MFHLEHLGDLHSQPNPEAVKRATGRYYTGEIVGRRLAREMVQHARREGLGEQRMIRVVDPFAGDGRLVVWMIEEWNRFEDCPDNWIIEFWDIFDVGFDMARKRISSLADAGIRVDVTFRTADSFSIALENPNTFDIVITNPPWELLKPDRRELDNFEKARKARYVAALRGYDSWLATTYPISQPKRKFAGWGTNLSRVGLDVSLRLTKPTGFVGTVLPASFLADDQSHKLRRHVLTQHRLCSVVYYPAEAKHYGSADVASITAVVQAGAPPNSSFRLARCRCENGNPEFEYCQLELQPDELERIDFVLPVAFGGEAVELLQDLGRDFATWKDLECDHVAGFWAGREVDETGSRRWLVAPSETAPLFLKGRMVVRFGVRETPTQGVGKPNWTAVASMGHERIAWRDVSRPNQKRRIIATIVPPGWALGNSLGVACFNPPRPGALRALLGVMSSTSFEFQLRAHLATGHVSLGSLRKVAIPSVDVLAGDVLLQGYVETRLAGSVAVESTLDAHVAKNVYGLTRHQYVVVLSLYEKIGEGEVAAYLAAYDSINPPPRTPSGGKSLALATAATQSASHQLPGTPSVIFNHRTARLSEVDMQMVRAIPQGGNWKNIPESVPSKRVEGIRASYARGEGSRSTYYGRLREELPSYTINTYFNRPGNGCHIHPTQDRVLSQREAARLQSFPDDFEFKGPQGAVNKQIGNAVPPLLAFQIARSIGEKAAYIDLFSGAGGMGLGFRWAGWTPVIANDIEARFLETYAQNVHSEVVAGSIASEEVLDRLSAAAETARSTHKRLWVLGGPPCQGFSTAGKIRSMDDPRNHLVWNYVRFLERVRPDGFVFENVTGLLNMKKGAVFTAVKDAFSEVMPRLDGTVLSADEYAVPQRRKRVFLVGRSSLEAPSWTPPSPITATLSSNPSLFNNPEPAVSVQEALADLPPLVPGQDGSEKTYSTPPKSVYQALMRGVLEPSEYLRLVSVGERSWGR